MFWRKKKKPEIPMRPKRKTLVHKIEIIYKNGAADSFIAVNPQYSEGMISMTIWSEEKQESMYRLSINWDRIFQMKIWTREEFIPEELHLINPI